MAQETPICTQVASPLRKKEDKVGKVSKECQVLHGEHKKPSKTSTYKLCRHQKAPQRRPIKDPRKYPREGFQWGWRMGAGEVGRAGVGQDSRLKNSRSWHMTRSAPSGLGTDQLQLYPSSESLPQTGSPVCAHKICLFSRADLHPLPDCSLRDQSTVICVSTGPTVRPAAS